MTLETDLCQKWHEGTLTRDDVQAEVHRLATTIGTGLPGDRKYLNELLSEKDLQHIGYCIHKLYDWWWGRVSIGPFLQAFVDDKLTLSWRKADGANWLGLAIYMEYLHNNAPGTWRWKKAKDYAEE
jgi:hypothetical protein